MAMSEERGGIWMEEGGKEDGRRVGMEGLRRRGEEGRNDEEG